MPESGESIDPAAIAAELRAALVEVPGLHAYGVVDGAQCVDLAYEAQIEYGKEIRSLFLPEVQTPLWDVAPYLVPIDVTSGYLDNWARRWGSNAGIVLLTAVDEIVLCDHLRKIFIVEDDEGQEYFFRYYDPRVLRTFLPTCSKCQLDEFFGPIEVAICESSDGRSILRSARQGLESVE